MFYKYIICILTYRNDEELEECLLSFKKNIKDYKAIVVNAFYDKESEEKCKQIADKYDCDFYSVPNKGYGYGNNRAIEYARMKYKFDFIIISNPDVEVRKFNDDILPIVQESIVAPRILTKNKKNQNPYWYKKNPLSEMLIYNGLKKNIKIFLIFGFGINKLIREISLIGYSITKKKKMQVYASHGCFCIIHMKVLEKIGVLYDENMFLFVEEAVLAKKLNDCGIKTYYTDEIFIEHKEDASMKLAEISGKDEMKKSFIYYYEKYIKKL